MRVALIALVLSILPSLAFAEAETWSPPTVALQACGADDPLPWLQKRVGGCVGAHEAPIDLPVTVRAGKPRARV